MKLFNWSIDITAINAMVLYQRHQNSKDQHPEYDVCRRRKFTFQLAEQLMEEQMKHREQTATTYEAQVFREIAEKLDSLKEKAKGNNPTTRKWCPKCQKNHREDCLKKCSKCQKNYCNKQVILVCLNCDAKSEPIPGPSRVATSSVLTRSQQITNKPSSKRCEICPGGKYKKSANKFCTNPKCHKAMCADHTSSKNSKYCTSCY
jgi:hypothetical protein